MGITCNFAISLNIAKQNCRLLLQPFSRLSILSYQKQTRSQLRESVHIYRSNGVNLQFCRICLRNILLVGRRHFGLGAGGRVGRSGRRAVICRGTLAGHPVRNYPGGPGGWERDGDGVGRLRVRPKQPHLPPRPSEFTR